MPTFDYMLLVFAYLVSGVLFAKTISDHIRRNAYESDDMLRMAVQQGSGSWSMRLPLLTLVFFWLPVAALGFVAAKLEQRRSHSLARLVLSA